MKLESIILSLEGFKHISKLMFQENKKTISKKQKDLEDIILNKNMEIS